MQNENQIINEFVEKVFDAYENNISIDDEFKQLSEWLKLRVVNKLNDLGYYFCSDDGGYYDFINLLENNFRFRINSYGEYVITNSENEKSISLDLEKFRIGTGEYFLIPKKLFKKWLKLIN